MNRRFQLSLICAGLAVLSCTDLGTQVPVAIERPHVSAAPPRSVRVVKQPVAATAAHPARSLVEAQILARLLRRHTGLSQAELPALARTIVEEAERHDLDPALVVAVIDVESAFYHRAVSPVGALGLMQLMPATGEELARKLGHPWRGTDSLLDPILNVKLGVAYLNQLERRFGDIPSALAAYNWGPRRIRERLARGHSLPAEYVNRVMTSYGTAEVTAG